MRRLIHAQKYFPFSKVGEREGGLLMLGKDELSLGAISCMNYTQICSGTFSKRIINIRPFKSSVR